MLYQRSSNDGCRCCDGDRSRRRVFLRGLSLNDSPAEVQLTSVPQGLRLAVVVVALALCSSRAIPAAAESPTAIQPTSDLVLTPQQAKFSVQSLASWAADQLPRVYEGDKNWGETKKLWAGVKVRRDGLKLKTNRRFREVRHGRWARYQLTLPPIGLVHADGRPAIEILVDDVHQLPDGRWQIVSSLAAPMGFDARVERWNLGLQWYSVSVRGDLRVRLKTTTTIGFNADYSEVPPALTIDPRVESAELALERFEVDRISKIGGDVAEEIGDFLKDVLRDRLVEKENQRLATKLNDAIEKQRDQLRWSLTDWLVRFAAH